MPSNPLSLRLLTPRDISALMRLRDEVLANLADPDLYVRESAEPEFVRMHVETSQGRGETLGLFDEGRLVAYGMLGLPQRGDPGNLGRFFVNEALTFLGAKEAGAPGLSLGEVDTRVAHLASCMVSTSYRGQHLQRLLLKARMALARSRGRNFCVAVVSPHNHASRHNLMHEGFRLGWVGEVDGLRRQLLAADLSTHPAGCSFS
ncbi:GNAT family N-acetyltransferase [Ottowia sp. VDI28]|uniref:GNAT family N-acetyltransferase n=1 Tax=Ottowia sp. VDI28 TaxID=3133968 RepID=UPI003C2F6FE4